MKEDSSNKKRKEIENKNKDFSKVQLRLRETSKMLRGDQLEKKKKNKDRRISLNLQQKSFKETQTD